MHREGTNCAFSRRALLAAGASSACALGAPPILAVLPAPVADTAAGRVRGATEAGIHVFRGVPYAATTAGANRFQPPLPPSPWSGVRNADRFGPRCPQVAPPPTGAFASWTEPSDQSEDCLVLNVWTPGLRDGRKRPVMVWVHGGGFSVGSGATNVNDGHRLSALGDVVVVTVNHRLNLFGYLYLDQLGGAADRGTANLGQLDLVAALRWVRDNIAGFGGDPGNVMVFGESGGGSKVAALLAMPSAAGLFHRAALQSGFGVTAISPDHATDIAAAIAKALGLSGSNLGGLRTATVPQLLDALQQVTSGNPTAGPGIVADGTVLPHAAFADGAPALSAQVPLLVGHNRTETTVLFPPPDAFDLTWDSLPGALEGRVRQPGPLVAGFRALRPAASPSDIFFAITTEAGMGANARKVADAKAALHAAPVYTYLLAWPTPAFGGKLRSPHALDLPLVFNTVSTSPAMIGSGTMQAQKIADVMSASWTAFARSGSPNGAGLPTWPAYNLGRRATMVFDVASGVSNDPLGAEQALIARHA